VRPALAEIADAIEVLSGGQVDSGPATPERVPVLARAQVKRNLDGRGGKRPTISDLHDSGDPGSTAGVVGGPAAAICTITTRMTASWPS
jgi:hypothetical protein